MKDHAPDMLRSTLTAGVVCGTLGAVPYLRLVSCCCLLATVAGFFAAYLYSRDCGREGAAFRAGAGASVGLITGGFYAFTQTIVGALVLLTIGNPDIRAALTWLRPLVPPENIPLIDQLLAQPDEAHLFPLIKEFFISILVAAVFSTLGGLIGGAAFKRSASPLEAQVEPEGPGPFLPPSPGI